MTRLAPRWLALLGLLAVACRPAPSTEASERAPDARALGEDHDAPRPTAPVAPGSVADVVPDSARAGIWNERVRSLVAQHLAGVATHSGGQAGAADVELSIVVRDLEHDTELASLAPEVARAPASCMKLVTTASALTLLGAGAQFLTVAEAGGDLTGDRLLGDLVLRAAGDPLVHADGDGRVEARLDALVEALRARGIARVTGDLVLDEGRFADPGPAPGWPDASQMWQEHCALAGGFSANGGVLQARITRAPNGRAQVAVHPAPHGLPTRYGVTYGGSTLDVRVGATRSAVTVRGTLPRGRDEYVAEFSHPDPVELFGHVLLDRLRRGGIEVAGGLRRERGAAGGERLGELRSPVDEILVAINAHSRNSVADQLFLALGHTLTGAGTRDGGEQAARLALERLGVPTTGFVQVDGSGLSRANRVSARQLTSLLAGVLRAGPDTARALRDSLAVAGEQGTLEERMEGTVAEGRVLGKTGWIRGVSSLTGICRTLEERELVFSILVAYPPSIGGLNTRVFKPMQDELVTRLVEGRP